MTISTQSNKVIVLGDGVTTVFPFVFPGVAGTDISVLYTDPTGVQTQLTQGFGPTQYTLALNAPLPGQIFGMGGTVTYNPNGTPIPAQSSLAIIRTLPLTQSVALQNQASYGQNAVSVETALDLLAMQIQQLNEQIGRSITINPADPNPPIPLPPAAQRAGDVLIFDSNGNPTAGAIVTGGVVSAAMLPVVTNPTLAGARTAMGLGAFATAAVGFGLQNGVSLPNNVDVNFALSQITTNQTLAKANHLTRYIIGANLIITAPRTTTLWNGYGFWIDTSLNLGAVQFNIDANDTIEGGGLGVGKFFPINDDVYITTNGAGTWMITEVPSTVFSVGDAKWRPTADAQIGWVLANGTSIGSASSSATQRANSDTFNLFAYLWNSCSNTICPVSGGRGANATADFLANKRIALLDMRGLVLGGLDDMGAAASGRLNSVPVDVGGITTPGSIVGESLHALTAAENGPHTHTYTYFTGVAQTAAGGSFLNTQTTTGTTDPSGSGTPHNTVQLTMIGGWYLKL